MPPVSKPAVLFRFATALLGRPVRAWSPAPPLPYERTEGFRLGADVTLWRLPVAYVRVRQRHRELEGNASDAPDGFRFPLMMADSHFTDWLTCTSWLIEHPDATILVDTGEAPDFGKASYFEGLPRSTAHLYPRIIDCLSRPDQNLSAALLQAGKELKDIDLCVLTHLHSDHVGNASLLDRRTRIVLSERETRALEGSGRLPGKLPKDRDRSSCKNGATYTRTKIGQARGRSGLPRTSGKPCPTRRSVTSRDVV